MNVYYKLLVLFQRGEKCARNYLLGRPSITEQLVDEAVKLGYIQEVDKTDIGEIRYMITKAGINKRDN